MAEMTRCRVMRLVYVAVGTFSLAIGVVAAAVPMVPTTPFVLLAAACYARGSKRFHDWLMAHPTFGSLIRSWQDHRAIPEWARPRALGMIAVGFCASVLACPVVVGKLMLVPIGVGVFVYVGRLPVVS